MAAPKKRLNIELHLSLSATFLSLAALIVSIFQTKIAREQQQASVWPYVQTSGSHLEDDFIFSVVNSGVGPAIIKKVDFTYKGNSYLDLTNFFDKVAERVSADSLRNKGGRFYNSFSPGDVLKAGDSVELYIMAKNESKAALLSEVIHDSSFHMRIVFSDVYGNCWRVDRNKVVPSEKCL